MDPDRSFRQTMADRKRSYGIEDLKKSDIRKGFSDQMRRLEAEFQPKTFTPEGGLVRPLTSFETMDLGRLSEYDPVADKYKDLPHGNGELTMDGLPAQLYSAYDSRKYTDDGGNTWFIPKIATDEQAIKGSEDVKDYIQQHKEQMADDPSLMSIYNATNPMNPDDLRVIDDYMTFGGYDRLPKNLKDAFGKIARVMPNPKYSIFPGVWEFNNHYGIIVPDRYRYNTGTDGFGVRYHELMHGLYDFMLKISNKTVGNPNVGALRWKPIMDAKTFNGFEIRQFDIPVLNGFMKINDTKIKDADTARKYMDGVTNSDLSDSSKKAAIDLIFYSVLIPKLLYGGTDYVNRLATNAGYRQDRSDASYTKYRGLSDIVSGATIRAQPHYYGGEDGFDSSNSYLHTAITEAYSSVAELAANGDLEGFRPLFGPIFDAHEQLIDAFNKKMPQVITDPDDRMKIMRLLQSVPFRDDYEQAWKERQEAMNILIDKYGGEEEFY